MLKRFVRLIMSLFECSYSGTVQWFYTLSILIHCLIAWRFMPEIALAFSIVWGLHFISLYLISYMLNHNINLSDESICCRFLILNILLLIVGLLICWWWTLITIMISTIAYIKAPVNHFNISSTKCISIRAILIYIVFLILLFGTSTTLFFKIIIFILTILYCKLNKKLACRGYCINFIVEDLIYIITIIKTKKEVKRFFGGKKH